jgi:hypothetical protein
MACYGDSFFFTHIFPACEDLFPADILRCDHYIVINIFVEHYEFNYISEPAP